MPSQGDSSRDNAESAAVYDELRRIAAERLRDERADHTLQPTALAHEAWLRLSETLRGGGGDVEQFRIAAAGSIRRVLVDHARARRAQKRGGAARRITLTGLAEREATPPLDLLALDDALEELAAKDARKARVVELRWFGGLSIDETARALDVATSTVEDDWAFARAWLRRRLGETR
jgi:RNA polymerase sigma-70 factor, ECF subfamily